MQFVGKTETSFDKRLNNHRKDESNPKSNAADLHIRQPGHSLKLHAKYILIE